MEDLQQPADAYAAETQPAEVKNDRYHNWYGINLNRADIRQEVRHAQSG